MNAESQFAQQQLRLVIGRLFALQLRDVTFRSNFIQSSGWTLGSPVIPCDDSTLFGEVHAIAMPAIRDTGARAVAIPVLHGVDKDGNCLSMTMSILTMGVHGGGDDPCSERAIDINSINQKVTMAQVVETLAPNKKWELSDLTKDYAYLTCQG